MSCGCTGTERECIRVFVGPCDEGINTGLLMPETGDYSVLLTFNGAAKQMVLNIEVNNLLVLPNTINNNAVYEMQIFKQDGTLLNDTCYSLKTVVTLGGATSQDPPNAPGNPKKFITILVAGSSVTDIFFNTNSITEIDTSNQVYLVSADFTQSGATITFINGNSLFVGQIILAKV